MWPSRQALLFLSSIQDVVHSPLLQLIQVKGRSAGGTAIRHARCCMQVLDKDKLYREGMIDQIKREIAIMKDLHHPHIVDLKEVMASKDKIYMVMEFMPGGELFDKIVSEGPLEVYLHRHHQCCI